MRHIQAKQLSQEAFHQYGDFYDILNPVGYHLGDFYHDRMLFPVVHGQVVAFSALKCSKPKQRIVDAAESHSLTMEFLLPVDGDVIIHVAPPSTEPVPELTEAFYIPKGTMVTLRVGVWHLAPFAVHEGETHVLIGLPERTYKNDCVIVNYDQDKQMIID